MTIKVAGTMQRIQTWKTW